MVTTSFDKLIILMLTYQENKSQIIGGIIIYPLQCQRKEHIMTYQIEESNKTKSEIEAGEQLDQITTEQLDAIAREFKPKSTYTADWEGEFIRRALSFAEMFEDGNEVIIKAKLQDQLPRMFEKMRDNVMERAEKLLRERRVKVRQDVGIEITGNILEDHDKKIDQMRQQYASLNHAFKLLLTHFRPMIQGQTGIDNGKYTQLHEFAKVHRMKKRNEKMTLDTLVNNRDVYDDLQAERSKVYPVSSHHEELMLDISNQDGIIEMPEDLE